MTEIKVGQIWRELDPRENRFVLVVNIGEGRRSIFIQTVGKMNGKWHTALRSYARRADRSRFNGKRGGYELVEDSR